MSYYRREAPGVKPSGAVRKSVERLSGRFLLGSGARGGAAADEQQRLQILVVEAEHPAHEPVEAAARPRLAARVVEEVVGAGDEVEVLFQIS